MPMSQSKLPLTAATRALRSTRHESRGFHAHHLGAMCTNIGDMHVDNFVDAMFMFGALPEKDSQADSGIRKDRAAVKIAVIWSST
jgi:hypothetical protein